jgi:hypothetical protein
MTALAGNVTTNTTTVVLNGTTITTTVVILDETMDMEEYNVADNLRFCAREGGKCACDGTVYFGKTDPLRWHACRNRPEECAANMLTHAYAMKGNQNADNPTLCRNSVFGDPQPGIRKMCFCEPPRETPITRCGLQGEDCACKGNVFIGKLDIDGVEPAPFASMMELPFDFKQNVTQKI